MCNHDIVYRRNGERERGGGKKGREGGEGEGVESPALFVTGMSELFLS